MHFPDLDPLLRQALEEDLGQADITSEAVLEPDRRGRATLLARQELVLAGWPVFVRVFELLGEVSAQGRCREGERVAPGPVGELQGPARVLLGGERVALNLLQHLCGIATQTRRFVDRIAASRVELLDTRKTTPLWRALEKYAVRMGGGSNHRMGLYDGVLIKENHVAMAGGLAPAVAACRHRWAGQHRIQVEVANQRELAEALEAGADAVLLDNMTPAQVREAVKRIAGRCRVEVSGGVTRENVGEYAGCGVDCISVGALTHSAPAVDLSLILEPIES